MSDPDFFDDALPRAPHERDSADELRSRLGLIEAQPLAERAEAYARLHDDLSRRLDSAPVGEGGDDHTA